MNGLVKDLLMEVAELLPALAPKHPDVPVDAPNFPNDLEPIIRADPVSAPPSVQSGSIGLEDLTMPKYDAWHEFLKTMDADEVVVTFAQLNELAPLPQSAREPLWWSNDNAEAGAWLSAGYTASVDTKEETVKFRKADRP
ncbi:MAG: hypothetical protein E5W21_03320 [Mesorhizobium sp.]|nr:MAG: hypothetical protein E5W21_03320 [Mesorhizobium sp.]